MSEAIMIFLTQPHFCNKPMPPTVSCLAFKDRAAKVELGVRNPKLALLANDF